MPIYEYLCTDCNQRFDYLLRNPKEEILCPKCKGRNLRRLISVFSFASKDAQGNTTSSSSSCSSCTSFNCSSCGK